MMNMQTICNIKHTLTEFQESSDPCQLELRRDSSSSSHFNASTTGRTHSSQSYSDDSCNVLESSDTNRPTKRKRCTHDTSNKVCAVCGDVAKSMHFGGMACDSCKAFFRRSVQSNSYRQFKCNAQKICPILKDNRRICQYCRFQKCQRSGMDVAWVMSEPDRMALWKSKLAKHRKSTSKEKNSPEREVDGKKNNTDNVQTVTIPPPTFVPASKNYFKSLTKEEREIIFSLTTLQETVFSSMPYPDECYGNTPVSLANLFFCICQKLRIFFFRLEEFNGISSMDQVHILRNGIAMSIYLHGAYNYDVVNEMWGVTGINENLRLPHVSKDNLRVFSTFPEIYEALMNFYNKYGNEIKDEVVLVLLSMTALFQDTDVSSSSKNFVNKMNNKYASLLKNYLVSKEGEFEGSAIFGKLCYSLKDLKQIVTFHNKVDIRPSVKPSEVIPSNDPFMRQLIALSELLKGNKKGNHHEHASVFTSEEKSDLLLSKQVLENSALQLPKCGSDPRPEIQYHYFTDSLFGNGIKTDRLLSFSLPNVLFGGRRPNLGQQLRQKKFKDVFRSCLGAIEEQSVTSHLQTNDNIIPTGDLQVATTSSSKYINHSNVSSNFAQESKNEYLNSSKNSNCNLNLNSEKEMFTLPSQLAARICDNKKINLETFKECLEYLSESEDADLLQLLQRKLSPKLKEFINSDIQNLSFGRGETFSQNVPP